MKDGVRKYLGAVLEHAYVWTSGLLIVHQIDSGYWQEWRLFGLPGGIQCFLVTSFVLNVPFLYGLREVARVPRRGAYYGIALAGLGVGAAFIHGWFLLQGRPEFRTPVSLVVLAGALVTSAVLGWASIAMLCTPEAE